ncbi:MAG: hypothetical protein WCD11_14685 [Solirubrobacteraceae bacterium]
MITKNTILRNISALAIAGTLAGVAATGAQAAAPGNHATGTAPAASGHSAQIAPQPQYSKRINLVDAMGYQMKLVSAWGDNEGLPEIGSTMNDGESQAFEVQYKAFGTGFVYAKYDIIGPWGQWLGDVTVQLSYDCFGATGAKIWGSNNIKVQMTGDGYGNPAVTGA